MLVVSIVVGLIYGIRPSIYWIEWIYYFFCMIMFLIAFGIFNSAVSILIRDYRVVAVSNADVVLYFWCAV